jgi:hypothetical protein
MKSDMRRLAVSTTERVLLESTLAYIEKFTSEMVQEDMRNPEIRAWLFDEVKRNYKKSKRKIGVPRPKSK